MKKKLFTLLIPFMMAGALTGCNRNEYGEYVAKVADMMPILLNSSTGKEIFASE